MKAAVPIETLMPHNLLPEKYLKDFKPQNLKQEPDTDYVKPETLYQVHPYKTIGRAFFKYEGRLASCSGSSSGNNAVVTAGHCIWLTGNFHTEWLFVPQYNNGTRPVGGFVGKQLLIFDSWRDLDYGRDVGFVIVEKFNNKTLQETVGYLEMSSCDIGEAVRSFGYPGPDYGAEKMVRTIASILLRFPASPWNPAPVGIRSKMGPGSSGGPWIMKFKDSLNNETNLVCSVNSVGVRFTYYVFGPYFDSTVLEFRRRAISIQ